MSTDPFSHFVAVAGIPAAGRSFRLALDDSARARLAEFVGVIAIPRMTADIEIRPRHGGMVSVSGQLEASVVQEDVVTLEPVPGEVAETIEVILRPAERPARARRGDAQDDPGEDEADVYHDGRIDLGALVAEHLAIGLDPYPRAPGVEFPGHVEDDPEKDESPFSSLSRLKGGDA